MAKAPTLVSLCTQELKMHILLLKGDDEVMPEIYELPQHLFDGLVAHLPPLALEKLQINMPFRSWNEYELTDDWLSNGRKRGRNGNFHRAWKALFKLRWPELVDRVQQGDWQQIYWERHLQNCLDEAAEVALRPAFNGRIGDIKISDNILRYISCEQHMNYQTCECKKLSYHCQEFGSYARCLRLLNVLCVAETCDLLRSAKLQSLVLRWIRSEDHVEPLCKLLIQNCETLTSLEFIHSKLSSSFVNAICDSLCKKDAQTHGIQHFSIKTSSFEVDPVSLPFGFLSFLKKGRSLCSLKFCDTHLDRNFGRMVFTTLLDSSLNICILDLSENNIAGWLSTFNWRSPSCSLSVEKSLPSLRLLNLRGNDLRKDDAENLRYALVHMPNLEILDLSDNPIEDDGIRSLIPYFVEASQRSSSLADLNLENCELSCGGVTQLLETLSTLKTPLKSLSVADNALGSQVAESLGNFLGSPIQSLNISGVGLGSAGFKELKDILAKELMLVDINISKNRGGVEAARFLSKLIPVAPKLVTVNASYNLMPLESLDILYSALKAAKGRLERVDLTGNIWSYQPVHSSLLDEFQHDGKPVLVLPSSLASNIPYDDDP